MLDIYVTVEEKIARTVGDPTIVSGNNDYTFHFDFDSGWEGYTTKTVRFAWKDKTTGQSQYRERLMTGDSVKAPAVHNTNLLFVGVTAGNIRTTTPAVLVCFGAITDDAPYHDDPSADIYEQLIDYLENGGGGGGGDFSPSGAPVLLLPGAVGGFTSGRIEPVDTVNMMQYTWEQGSSSTTTGDFSLNSNNRIRCKTFVPVPAGAYAMRAAVLSTADATIYYRPYWYSSNAVSGYIGCDSFVRGDSGIINIPDGANHVRFVVSKTVATTAISPSDLDSFGLEFI